MAQNVNLAAPLTRGAKLYIPAVGKQMMTSGNTSSGGLGSVNGTSTKTVNINQASESDLDALPGVGPYKKLSITGRIKAFSISSQRRQSGRVSLQRLRIW